MSPSAPRRLSTVTKYFFVVMTTCFALAAGLYLALNEVELKGDARRARAVGQSRHTVAHTGVFWFFLVLFFLPIGTA